jgi:glycosyltransferase involved in cell wall biosynthesis
VSQAVPEVSVVIPTRDRWELAAEALRGALAQEAVGLEVCVVDDGSEAQPPPGFASDPRVRMLRNERSRGVAAARNRGIAEARAPWVAFLDDDDVWAPWHLARLLSAAKEAGREWAFAGHVITSIKRAPLLDGPRPAVERDVKRQFLHANPVGTPSCALVSSAALERVGGFDEQLSVLADWELWVRLATDGPPAVSGEFTVGYAHHKRSMSLAAERVEAEQAEIARRYADELERLGIAFADNQYYWRWLARGHASQRHRRLAIRYFLRAARQGGGGRDVVRAVSEIPVLGWPIRLVRHGSALVRRRRRFRRARPLTHPWLQSFAERTPQR